jgi:hypothetical protein
MDQVEKLGESIREPGVLQLQMGCLQFFAHGLQVQMGCLQFFAHGLQVQMRCLQFFAHGLKLQKRIKISKKKLAADRK